MSDVRNKNISNEELHNSKRPGEIEKLFANGSNVVIVSVCLHDCKIVSLHVYVMHDYKFFCCIKIYNTQANMPELDESFQLQIND